MAEPTAPVPVGHPIEGVFMKCWRCQKTYLLKYDGNGGLRCPGCWEILISLEDPAPAYS